MSFKQIRDFVQFVRNVIGHRIIGYYVETVGYHSIVYLALPRYNSITSRHFIDEF